MNFQDAVAQVQDAVTKVWLKKTDFSGRATRAEFWWLWAAAAIVFFIASGIDSTIFFFVNLGPFGPVSFIVNVAIVLLSLAVGVRRLHDIGKPGWWLAIWYVVPAVGWLPYAIGTIAFFNGGFSMAGYAFLWVGIFIGLLVGLAIVVWAGLWLAHQGETGPNLYGPDPRAEGDPEPAPPALE